LNFKTQTALTLSAVSKEKKMKKFALICATLLLSALAFQVPFTRWVGSPSVASAETPGQDGDLTISAANTVVNRYATLSANALAGATSITVANAGGANGLDPATLQPGNLLLIIQMQGADIDSSDTISYGLVTDLKSAGRYEFITVGSVAGNVISIACGGLRFAYTTSGKTQVIRVPQYANLTVNAGGSIVAPAWNGSVGGVVAVNVQNNTTINGRIDVSGLGFRGGQTSANGIGFDNTSFRTGNVDLGGEKGEGVAGNGTVYDGLNGRFGRGAPGNGGGGGTSHNSGGGGGANGNNGNIYNGNGVMDGTVVGAAAWAQDPAFAANGNALTNSSGGGRGGYTYSDPATDQNALTVPPGAAAWEGDRRRAVGGLGGRGLANDPAGRIFAGGGGGAAHQNNGDGGAGGNGGGIVFLLANGIAGTGQIRANGTNGGDSIDEHRDGAGGGGAGGSVVVVSNAYAGVSIESRGGNGGTHGRPIGRFGNEGHGPGGGGGGGYVAVAGGVPVTDVTGGASGVSLANTLTEFPVNGATRGASGVSNAAIVSIPFSCATDLAILKTSPATVVLPGTSITYSIVASNNGPNPVVGARVIDTLPATLSGATWSCVATAGSSCPSPANGTGNINTTVNLLVGGSATFTLTANVSAAAPAGALSNTATIGSPTGAVDPVPGNNTSTYTVQLTRGVTETINARMISDDTCIGAGKFLTVQNVISNAGPGTQGDNPGPEFTTLIPAQLDLVPNSCTASSGQCDLFQGRVEWNGTLNNGQSATITFQVKVKASVTQGTRFCLTARTNYDSNGDGTNDTQAASQACATADCVPGAPCVGAGCGTVGPGTAFPYNKGLSDQAPGSILFYPYYTSNPAQAPLANTRISLTNTSTTSAANVHLFFVDGNSCSISDRYICLTQNQTTSFLASDLDPGTTGYLIAVATDLLGCPVSHNFLIGDEYVKTSVSGQPFFGSLGAEAISALFDFSLPGCDANSVTGVIRFNGLALLGYEQVPAVLSATNILSRADGNRTFLVVNRVGGNLAIGASTLGTLFGILYDDQETPASFNFGGGCQFRAVLSDDFPKTTPRFELKIPAGQSGWMKFFNQSGAIGLIGCVFNSNTSAGGFNGAHMLHKTSLTTLDGYIVPVFPPSC
jgi:uncharacterized repeat protein (TIGR01451 family)